MVCLENFKNVQMAEIAFKFFGKGYNILLERVYYIILYKHFAKSISKKCEKIVWEYFIP